jgi:hypothetical protein
MKSVKTARGRTLDMSALAAKNETARAVSNVPVNARGDIIDSRGNVTIPQEKVSQQYYKNTVPGSDEKSVSVKQEVKTKPKKSKGPAEISRTLRERKDGTVYEEVEYSDGSMSEEEIK